MIDNDMMMMVAKKEDGKRQVDDGDYENDMMMMI